MVAWSNEAFELWYLLHFVYLYAAISRSDYIKKLENEIRRIDGYANYNYKKNDAGIYSMLQRIAGEPQAKQRAARLQVMFEETKDYKSHKPCTCVDILVDELEHPDNLLNGI